MRAAAGESSTSPKVSRARARSGRRILDAARTLVETQGLDDLSMRRLADEAEVSPQTIYNVFGDKRAVVTALVLQSFQAMDEAVAHTRSTDPIERIWDTVRISVEANCRYVPRAVVAAVVTDEGLSREVAHRWSGIRLILDAVESATNAGALRRELPPERILEQVGPMHAYRLRQWADARIDEATLRDSVLYLYDMALLTVARPKTRHRLLEHMRELESSLPELVPGLDDLGTDQVPGERRA